MRSEWQRARLGQLGRIVTGKTPITDDAGNFGGAIPFLTPSDFVDGHRRVITARTLSQRGLSSVKNCLVPRGVAVSCIGWQMGKSVLIDEPTVTNQQINTIVPNEALVDRLFLYYSLLSIRNKIFELGATSTRTPIVNKTTFSSIEIPLPSLPYQRAISSLLGALDDRIDLLRQTNATLESIAQALFKSWFIDFDPVRARTEGREPEGMDAETAALFPDSFEDSALGQIPKGWRVGPFGDIAGLVKGSINPMTEPADTFEHYSLPAFDASQLPVFELGEAIKSNKTRVPAGAVLQSKLNPHIPRVWFPSRVGERAVCSTEFLPWVSKGTASAEVIYCTLTSPTFAASVRTLVTGTSNSHQRVKPDQVAALALVLAPSDVYDGFTRAVRALLARVGEGRWTAKSLADLRDTLLPRLISGKLRLPEAEAQLNEAVA